MRNILTVYWGRGLVYLICIFAAFCVVPVWAGDVAVSREIDPSSVPVGGETRVTLSISGMSAGGIVETIPEGFTFLKTSYPADNYRISGQKLTFAVIGETEITYQVRAEGEGARTFTGTWNDAVSKKEGTIPPTTVNGGSGAAAGAAPAGTDRATPGPTSAGGSPWAWIALTLAAAVIVAGAYGTGKKR
jgi:hypothetical protein